MQRDFEIKLGIYLVQGPHELDLHNDYDFHGLSYSVAERRVQLQWGRSPRRGISVTLPASVSIEFADVSEFRYRPRDSVLPFTEDDCLSCFGYWTDEEWADGVMILDLPQVPEPHWLTAVEFMSGAMILIQADSAHARVAV